VRLFSHSNYKIDCQKLLETLNCLEPNQTFLFGPSWISKHLPIDLRKACVSASVLDISSEKISEPASIVKGVSSPKLLAMPMLHTKSQSASKLTRRLAQIDDLREGSLACAGLATDQDGASRDLALSNHAQDDSCSPSRIGLK